MSELPEYLRAPLPHNWADEITSDVRVRLRIALRDLLRQQNDTTGTRAYVTLCDDMLSFLAGYGLSSESDSETVQHRHNAFEEGARKMGGAPGEKILVAPELLKKFVEGDPYRGRQTKTNIGTVAFIRDYLVWRRRVRPEDLLRPVTYMDDAYRLWSVVRPKASIGQKLDRFSRGEANYGAALGQMEGGSIIVLNMRRLREGLFALSWRQQTSTGDNSYSLSSFFGRDRDRFELEGWLFQTEFLSIGFIQPAIGSQDASPVALHISEIHSSDEFSLHFGFEIVEFAPGAEIDANTGDTLRFVFLDKKHEVMYNELPHRDIYGGDKFVNNGVGDEVNDYTDQKYGVELNKALDTLTNPRAQLRFSASAIAERDKLHERVEELIKGGAPLDTPNRNGWYPLSIIAGHHFWRKLELVLQRSDVNFLVKTPDGRYPFQFQNPDALDNFTLPIEQKLYARTLDQAKASGMTENQLLGIPDDAPPFPIVKADGPV